VVTSRNQLTGLIVAEGAGRLSLDLQDQIVRETLLTHEGEIVNSRVREFFAVPPLVPREPAERGDRSK